MKELMYKVEDPMGLHARPASKLMMEAMKYQCAIKAVYEGSWADVKSILDLMGLGALGGSQILFRFEGPDEESAMEAIGKLLQQL